MSDLKTQIRLYFDDVVEHVDLGETLKQRVAVEPVPAPRPHPRIRELRHRWIYALVGAAVVLLLFLGVVLLTSPDSAVDPVAPSPTTPTAPSTAPFGPDSRAPFATDSVVGRWGWKPVESNAPWLPHGFAGGHFYHSQTGAIDVSEDGLAWSPLAGPTSISRMANYRRGVVSDMFISYTIDLTAREPGESGAARGGVTMWRYESGSWVEFPSPVEPGGDIEGAFTIRVDVVGSFVVASCCDPTLAGFSDGWMRVSKDGGPFATADLPAPAVEVWKGRQLVSLNGGLLALLDQNQLWASDDGLNWTQIEPGRVDLGGISGSEDEDDVFLAGGDDRVFFLGMKTTWTSSDGRVWEATDLQSEVGSVWPAPFGWVALSEVGWTGAGETRQWIGVPAKVFVSTDGVTWNTIEAPPDTCFGSFAGDILFVSTCGDGGGEWTASLGGD